MSNKKEIVSKQIKNDDYIYLVFKYPVNKALSEIPEGIKEYFCCLLGKNSGISEKINELVERD